MGNSQSIPSSSLRGGSELDGVLLIRPGIVKTYIRKTVSSILNMGNWMWLRGKFWEVIGN